MFNKIFQKKLNNNGKLKDINYNKIPKHIAIIMDGNGRWAKEKNMPRIMGHRAGVEAIREIVKECNKLKIEHLTLYAFSTENWKRPKDEVNGLMKLLVEYLKKEVEELHSNNVKINFIGNTEKLPDICQNELYHAYTKTKYNNGLQLNLALNYGGRDEILTAVRKIVSDVKQGELDEKSIDSECIKKYLYTNDMPDPDIIIRTSGEQRLSNFLLWQSAYSELWFSDVRWPDFNKQYLYKAIYDYQNRDRRFGAL